MSVAIIHITGVIFGYMSLCLAYGAELPNTLVIAFGALGMVSGLLLHWYSPLPATNGGFGEPSVTLQQWGFTNEPMYDDYEKPKKEDVMRPAFFPPINHRSRNDGDSE